MRIPAFLPHKCPAKKVITKKPFLVRGCGPAAPRTSARGAITTPTPQRRSGVPKRVGSGNSGASAPTQAPTQPPLGLRAPGTCTARADPPSGSSREAEARRRARERSVDRVAVAHAHGWEAARVGLIVDELEQAAAEEARHDAEALRSQMRDKRGDLARRAEHRPWRAAPRRSVAVDVRGGAVGIDERVPGERRADASRKDGGAARTYYEKRPDRRPSVGARRSRLCLTGVPSAASKNCAPIVTHCPRPPVSSDRSHRTSDVVRWSGGRGASIASSTRLQCACARCCAARALSHDTESM